MKKLDIIIKTAIFLVLVPVSLVYIRVFLPSGEEATNWLIVSPILGLVFAWWAGFTYHTMTFRKVPKYIWLCLIAEIIALFPYPHWLSVTNAGIDGGFAIVLFFIPLVILPGFVQIVLLLLIWNNSKPIPDYIRKGLYIAGAIIGALLLLCLFAIIRLKFNF